jgi:PAS domain S-box-containing protein
MKDQDKTKEQFIQELVESRQRITELEAAGSKHRRAEEVLQESEEKYRDLFENARDVIVTFDLKGKVTTINKAVALYGFKEDEFAGKRMLKFVSKEYWPRLLKELAKIAQGDPIEGEIKLITPKGERIAEYRSNPTRRGKKVVGFQTILRDITERKQAQKALVRRASQLQIIGEVSRKVSSILNVDELLS